MSQALLNKVNKFDDGNSKGKDFEDFRESQLTQKIEILSAERRRNDVLVFTFWMVFNGNLELGEYEIEEFWNNETSVKVKVVKIRGYELDISLHFCDQRERTFIDLLGPRTYSLNTFEILDLLVYEK